MTLSATEEKILNVIKVPSENNPLKPEFPPDSPKFPATPTYKIKVPGFSDVWLKDESVNPTGTHKDRMAWDIVVTYRDFLIAKKNGQIKGPLPQMSIISSGSTVLAIQTQLKKYDLPNLKVLVDAYIEEEFLDEALRIAEDQKINCEPSGIGGLALMLQMKDKLPKNKKMLIVNTGKAKWPAK